MTHDPLCTCMACLSKQAGVVFSNRAWTVPAKRLSVQELTRLIELENRERRAFHAFMLRVLTPVDCA